MIGRVTLHLVAWCVAFLVLSVLTEEVYPSSVQLKVSATVLKKAWMRVLTAPQALSITRADLDRGYVEVPESTVLLVRNNSPEGFAIELQSDPRLVAEVALLGLPGADRAVFSGGSGVVTQPGYFQFETRLELRWRLRLGPGAAEGLHPWPVQLQVQAV